MLRLKGALSPARRRLLERMQALNFGRIHNLAIRNGEPLFIPSTRVERDVKLGCPQGPRSELGIEDFTLKQEVVALFSSMEELGDGTIEHLEIKHGLPFLMRIVEGVA